jgi:DNA modification methylase
MAPLNKTAHPDRLGDNQAARTPSPPQIEMIARKQLKLPPQQLRTHSGAQVAAIAKSITTFGFLVPIVVDDENIVRAGIGRMLASERLGLIHVPAVRAGALSTAKKRAFALADNKLAEQGRWDREALAAELPELQGLLLEEDLDVAITGFSAVEIDQIVLDFEENSADPADDIQSSFLAETAVTKPGDTWYLGAHKLWCGDAADRDTLSRMVGDRQVAMAFLDPPYNLKVSDIVGRGHTKHAEFAMASGEMTPAEFIDFLERTLSAAVAISRDGAVHFVCMDWRHLPELFKAGRTTYGALLNLAVWVKSNGGQGSFYRSQHEHIAVFRVGTKSHLNNIELGRHGRSRTNVWSYAGVNSFRAGRLDDLRAHPTVKPIGLVIDAMKDCTRRGDIILDTFCGSGTTLLAAERVGRHFVGAEIEPRFVDLAIKRWQQFTGREATHANTDRTFDDIAAKREQTNG